MHSASRCYYSTMIISNSDTVTVKPFVGQRSSENQRGFHSNSELPICAICYNN